MNQLIRVASHAVLLAMLALAACGEDGTGPDKGPSTGEPVQLPVLGLGAVPERFTSELWVRGDYAYTGSWGRRGGIAGNTLLVWDVRGDTPIRVDSVLVPGASTLGDVQVSDDGTLLVVAMEHSPGAIAIYSLADPARPQPIGQFSSANTAPGVHTAEVARVNGRLHAFLSVDPSPARLVIVDLGDPANPREVFAGTMGNPFVHDVFVRDGLLFTALWDDGMTIWDIGGGGQGGSPSNPVQIGNVVTAGGNVHNLLWFHDPATGSKRYVFVGEEVPLEGGFAGDVHVVDISNPASPKEVAFFSVPGAGTHNFSVDEKSGVLYAAYYDAGVRALDIRGDLGSCEAAHRAQDGRCDLGKMGREIGRGLADYDQPVMVWGVQHVGRRLYASDMLNGLFKLDASALTR